jgi:hypothetical protein
VYYRFHQPDCPDGVGAAVSDARWFEVDSDNYDSFQVQEATRTIGAAEMLANELHAEILIFRKIIDPPKDVRE